MTGATRSVEWRSSIDALGPVSLNLTRTGSPTWKTSPSRSGSRKNAAPEGALNVTLTSKPALLEFPTASAALQATVVVPGGNSVLGPGVQWTATVPLTASVALGSG